MKINTNKLVYKLFASMLILVSIDLTDYRYIQGHIGHRIAAAGMDPAELLVRQSAAIGVLRNVNITADQTGVAPATFAAAAVRGSPDTGLLQCIQQGLVGTAVYRLGFAPDQDGNGVGFAGSFCRVGGIGGGVAVFAGQLLADAAPLQIQLCQLPIGEGIHGLGAAEEHGIITLGCVLCDQLRSCVFIFAYQKPL